MHRGETAAGYNVLEYFVGTYEEAVGRSRDPYPKPSESNDFNANGVDSDHESDEEGAPRTAGRPAHPRIKYSTQHPRYETHHRVVRPTCHNNLPNFIGPRFPRQADPDQADLHAASALTLLKPWRTLADLKEYGQPWIDALDIFLSNADQRTRNIISSMDHYHACKSAADSLSADIVEDNNTDKRREEATDEDVDMLDISDDLPILKESDVTEEMITAAALGRVSKREFDHSHDAVRIGRVKGVFHTTPSPLRASADRGSLQSTANLKAWQNMLQQIVSNQSSRDIPESDLRQDLGGVSNIGSVGQHSETGAVVSIRSDDNSVLSPAAYNQLFPEQKRAFNIISSHIAQTIDFMHNGKNIHSQCPAPQQLLMLLIGEGGTGKSKVIQTVTADFERKNMGHLLIKSAYTGK
jgi:hypothetical protein